MKKTTTDEERVKRKNSELSNIYICTYFKIDKYYVLCVCVSVNQFCFLSFFRFFCVSKAFEIKYQQKILFDLISLLLKILFVFCRKKKREKERERNSVHLLSLYPPPPVLFIRTKGFSC